MRDHADVARKQLRTSSYPPEARARLGEAVEAARIAAGYRYRTDFCRSRDIKNLRGLELLEQGKTGVGQAFLFEVADALPGWTRDTPRLILEGKDPPTATDQEIVDDDALLTEPAPGRPDFIWTSEDETKYQLLKSMLQAQGLELTPRLFAIMKDQYEIEKRRRRASVPDDSE